MDLKHTNTASELERSLSSVITLVEGTIQLLDDAAWRHGGDVRYDAFRALIAEIRTRISEVADAAEASSETLQEQL